MLPWTLFQGKKETMLILSVVSNRYHCKDVFPQFEGPWHFLPYESSHFLCSIFFFLTWLKNWFTEIFISPLFSIQNWYFQISTQHPEKVLKSYGNKDMNTFIKGRKGEVLNLLNILSSFVSKVKDLLMGTLSTCGILCIFGKLLTPSKKYNLHVHLHPTFQDSVF